jgi:hypothetical protein
MSQVEKGGFGEMGPAFKPFEKLMREVEDYILDKYQTPQPKEEARLDAVAYASTMLIWHKIEALAYSGDEYADIANGMSAQWRGALIGARRGKWSRMKDMLEESAGSAEQSARARKGLFDQDKDLVFGGEQSPAVAFLNLKNSL